MRGTVTQSGHELRFGFGLGGTAGPLRFRRSVGPSSKLDRWHAWTAQPGNECRSPSGATGPAMISVLLILPWPYCPLPSKRSAHATAAFLHFAAPACQA